MGGLQEIYGGSRNRVPRFHSVCKMQLLHMCMCVNTHIHKYTYQSVPNFESLIIG